jgi:hypothetical protein
LDNVVDVDAADYTIRIAPLRLELAPAKKIDTFAYDGVLPEPAPRLRNDNWRFGYRLCL